MLAFATMSQLATQQRFIDLTCLPGPPGIPLASAEAMSFRIRGRCAKRTCRYTVLPLDFLGRASEADAGQQITRKEPDREFCAAPTKKKVPAAGGCGRTPGTRRPGARPSDETCGAEVRLTAATFDF